jgi:tRNA A-37 threonylcarbamoyl transferase component Bud32
MTGTELEPGTELTPDTVVAYLQHRGLLDPAIPAIVGRLAGGVSNDVLAVRAGPRNIVVKQALAQLRVEADWHADPDRILTEAAALRLAGEIRSGAVPPVLDVDAAAHVLVIGRAPETFRLWKDDLMAGQVVPAVPRRLGELLAAWHSATASRPELTRPFAGTDAFVELRIDPFYRATALANPDLRTTIDSLADRLLTEPICLVHGDFSPKNVLTGPDGVWVLDWEVAHLGDPTFDLAFLISHLLCKAIYRPESDFRIAAEEFLAAYRSAAFDLPDRDGAYLAAQTACLVLARVDGKSPVDYLDPAARRRARECARAGLRSALTDPLELWELL